MKKTLIMIELDEAQRAIILGTRTTSDRIMKIIWKGVLADKGILAADIGAISPGRNLNSFAIEYNPSVTEEPEYIFPN